MIRNSFTRETYGSYTEENALINFNSFTNLTKIFNLYFFRAETNTLISQQIAHCVWKDMLHLVCMWRQIHGYPTGGATTHTNAKTSKKNKFLYNYRLEQFYKLFGKKKRNIYPTLIKAEYNNRLWYTVWRGEWLQASFFVERMLDLSHKQSNFNPSLLASNQTNGYTRIGKAAKIGKSKKLTKVFTVGVPLFFTRFIYYDKIPAGLSKRLVLREEVNKSLGKKLKRKNNK